MRAFWDFITAFALGLMLCGVLGLAGCGFALRERIVRPTVTVLDDRGEGRHSHRQSVNPTGQTRVFRVKLRSGEIRYAVVGADGKLEIIEQGAMP